MFVREADERYGLGAATVRRPSRRQLKSSYLDLDRLEQALLRTKADAAWVGWGFVAEQAAFAELCQRLGVCFIGPTPEAMRRAGDKITAKRIAEAVGVPVAPWSGGRGAQPRSRARARPPGSAIRVMVKASAGGGGRGIRRVDTAEDLERGVALGAGRGAGRPSATTRCSSSSC